MKLKNAKGMTLVEILVAAFIFAIALGPLLQSLTGELFLIDLAKGQTRAIFDSRNMMEAIKVTPFANMTTLFEDGTVDGPAANRYDSLVGGYSLPGEHITVTYADIATDPLEIEVEVAWQDRRGQVRSVSAFTFKTR
ncbi:prepilin-type N-terminal cleavage/methylation domain-containing protein [Candidatus Omnitrophota bacterium]